MKTVARIAKVETFVAGMSCFVRLTTEDGIQGVGESTAFAFPKNVAEVIKSYEGFLIGANAHDVEANWLNGADSQWAVRLARLTRHAGIFGAALMRLQYGIY